MDLQATLKSLAFLPLRLLIGGNPPPKSGENTKSFLEKCDGPIAHRGGIPENTLVAIRESEQSGAVAIEVDLAFTKDHHPVLLHDTTVDRTCDGTGNIHSLTFEEVRKFDFGFKTGVQYKGEKLPTLQETLDLLKNTKLQLLLEVKDNEEHALPIVVDMFAQDRSLLGRVAVISFYPIFLLEVRRKNPDIVTGLIASGDELSYYLGGKRKHSWWLIHQMMVLLDRVTYWFLTKWVWRRLGVGFLMPNKADILNEKVNLEYYRKQGVGVIPWTVNSQQDKQHFENVLKMPFITDCVDGYAPD